MRVAAPSPTTPSPTTPSPTTPSPSAPSPTTPSPTTPSAPGERVGAGFTAAFGGSATGRWWAPGRVNLIGEHTDYNEGFVLPLALGHGVAAAARVRADGVLRVASAQQGDVVQIVLADITPASVSGWSAYVAGVAWALRERGHELPGLDVWVDGDVPVGAGLSSSAALECALALAWNDLAALDCSRQELATVARSAENDVVGVPTGVMDQVISLRGQRDHLLFLDTRSLGVEQVPFDLASAGLALLVIDTHAPHALVHGEYAERRRSCARAAAQLGVVALRDVPVEGLAAALERLDDDLLRRRVRHVVTEDARVLHVVAQLREGVDPRRIGPTLTASHVSMRDDFDLTVPQVDTAVRAALAAGAHGARMTGGGFGGCVLALVDADGVEEVRGSVQRAYAAAGFAPSSSFVATAHDGAHRL